MLRLIKLSASTINVKHPDAPFMGYSGVYFFMFASLTIIKLCELMLAALALIMTCGHVLASSQLLLPCGLYGGQRSDC